MRESESSGEDMAKGSEKELDEFDLEHPEIAFALHDGAFMDCDLDEVFGEKPIPDQDALQNWLLERALDIVEAETRPGETIPDVYDRREEITSTLVQRAFEILGHTRFFDDEEDEEDPDVEGPGSIPPPNWHRRGLSGQNRCALEGLQMLRTFILKNALFACCNGSLRVGNWLGQLQIH